MIIDHYHKNGSALLAQSLDTSKISVYIDCIPLYTVVCNISSSLCPLTIAQSFLILHRLLPLLQRFVTNDTERSSLVRLFRAEWSGASLSREGSKVPLHLAHDMVSARSIEEEIGTCLRPGVELHDEFQLE
jgi:hypothetical protein